MTVDRRRGVVEPGHAALSIVRQCKLPSISRTGFYYVPTGESAATLALMRLIDEAYLLFPYCGSCQMARRLPHISIRRGFMYLVAVMDRASRRVLSWRVSNTMVADFCIDALEEARAKDGRPKTFNTDQKKIHRSALHRDSENEPHQNRLGRARPLDGQRFN